MKDMEMMSISATIWVSPGAGLASASARLGSGVRRRWDEARAKISRRAGGEDFQVRKRPELGCKAST